MFFIFLSVVADHKVHPPEKPDLVQVMLTGRDKETGLGLTDESVKNNVCLEWVPVTVNATDLELAAAYIPNCWSASFHFSTQSQRADVYTILRPRDNIWYVTLVFNLE